MTESRRIDIEHLTRVEGHGHITAVIEDGRLKEARFDVIEAPRLFEVFLKGHDYREVVHLASRICGICAVSHRTAAIKAVEAAFGTQINERIELLRRLAFHGEVVASHLLHLFFLQGPDFFGLPSVFHMLAGHKETVQRALRVKRCGLEICRTVAGRHIHPVAMEAGGFSFDPNRRALENLRGVVEEGLQDLRPLLALLGDRRWTDFRRKTAYLSLRDPDRYAFCNGTLFSSRTGFLDAGSRRRIIEEYTVDGSTAKHAAVEGSPFMVGALARFNNSGGRLAEPAREAAESIGLSAPCTNPFMIPAAQAVETVHCLTESLTIIDRLCEEKIAALQPRVPVRPSAGTGTGAVEAPRGTLFHEYAFDDAGICTHADLLIPTAQNLANLEADMKAFLPPMAEEPDDVLGRRLSRLVRAYDPCISCATHVVRLDR